MFLKSLSLKGFKSFADPATLVLEPGVTVVVGPNGSGKSNVADAVAWVLGAQGPRTVRSTKMEDVIFAGSADRPALGRAEVSLTIDNHSGSIAGAPAEITITRTLFRSGDSEYAINAEPCRLLDVQELLADSGVGRQQHVIIGQGQLDHVLNARPEDRRAIIEEAAGILKHRRRRERSERRLAATEGNLERLGDLVREVRRQIRPLERQAAATRSYGALAEELRGLRLHLVGREISALDARLAGAAVESESVAAQARALAGEIASLDTLIDAATAELSARSEEDLVTGMAKAQGLLERCRGLASLLGERKKSLQRQLESAVEADAVATSEAEAVQLAAELAAVDDEVDAMRPALEAADRELHQVERDIAAHEAEHGDMAELRSAGEALASARGQVDPIERSLEKDRRELSRATAALQSLDARLEALACERRDAAGRLDALRSDLPELAAHAERARNQATEASIQRGESDKRVRALEAERHRLAARAEAFAVAAAQARGSSGAELLEGLEGVAGAFENLVEVDDGWHAAFEAAIGASLAAVAVWGAGHARHAVERLEAEGARGILLVLDGLSDTEEGPGPVADLPHGTERLRDHVRPLPGMAKHATGGDGEGGRLVAALLDRVLAGAVVVTGGWHRAVDVFTAHPDLVVCTFEGDRFSSTGWLVRAAAFEVTPASAAEMARMAAAAAAKADAAMVDHEAAVKRVEETSRLALEAERTLERAAQSCESIAAGCERLDRQAEALGIEREDLLVRVADLAEQVDRQAAQLSRIEEELVELQRAARDATSRMEMVVHQRRHLEDRRVVAERSCREIQVRVGGLVERRAMLADRLLAIEHRLAGREEALRQADDLRRRVSMDLVVIDRLAVVVAASSEALAAGLADFRTRRDRHAGEIRSEAARVENLRHQRLEHEQRLNLVVDKARQLDLELAEAKVRRQAAVESLYRELGCSPEEALGAPCPEIPEGADPEQRAAQVASQLAALGPVNPLALEELSALEERLELLDTQMDDIKKTRRSLNEVVAGVDDEISRLFTEAFADVNEHFSSIVSTLFPGGTGRLSLADPGNLLDTGVEVEARPAGKNVRKLSLLSGGERSLVALAFLFAVFRSRPSPFYLMDEVEAALDDVNLHRFLDLLHEFRGEAQLIVISHQKRTMEAADALYGITMTPGGASKVVSEKVKPSPAGEADPVPTGLG
ncbi:MAG: chromosome segregation protein SMC [Acidimicrobiales bacterium]